MILLFVIFSNRCLGFWDILKYCYGIDGNKKKKRDRKSDFFFLV